MRRLSSLKTSLRTRFIIGTGAMLLPLMVLGVSAFASLEIAIQGFEEAAEETIQEMPRSTRIEQLMLRVPVPVKDYLKSAEPMERDNFTDLSREVDNAFQDAFTAPYDVEEKALLKAAQKEWQEARKLSEFMLTQPLPEKTPNAAQSMERLQYHIGRSTDILSQIYDVDTQEINEQLKLAEAGKQRVLFLSAIVFGAGLTGAFIIRLALARSILLPLRLLEIGVARFGEGDLSIRIPLDTPDELGQLARVFNTMAENLEKSQAALKDLAIHDGLTGVYNSREFHQRFKEEIERSRHKNRACSLMMVDIDHFKRINDTYGHQAGDEALRVVADLIKREVRSTDQVARYGGEEFSIILPDTPSSTAIALAERLRKLIASHPITIAPQQTINLTVSIGLAEFPQNALSEKELISEADQALYAAKRAGRNRVIQFTHAVK